MAFLFAVLLLLVTACGGEEDQALAGMVREPPPNVAGVLLPDASTGGGDFEMVADEGRILVVYFGYTYCPDICPTTMSDLRTALRILGDDAALVDMAMVSVDPERDTGERLTEYVQTFFPTGHALRTDDPVALEDAAFAFGAAYEVVRTEDGTIEDVAHSAFLYAIDSEGTIHVQWPFGMTSEDMAADLEKLIRRLT